MSQPLPPENSSQNMLGVTTAELARSASISVLAGLPTSVDRHPVVPDANVLFQDVVRLAGGRHCVLAHLAQLGAIKLFVPAHMPAKADEHLERIACQTGVDPNLALQIWRDVYLPLLRVVDVPAVSDPRVEAVDEEEDHSFAQLAILLGPSLLLTRDGHLLDVGLGTEAPADLLIVMGRLIELDAMVHGGAQTAVLVAGLLALAVRGAARVVSESPVAAGAYMAIGLMALTDWCEGAPRGWVMQERSPERLSRPWERRPPTPFKNGRTPQRRWLPTSFCRRRRRRAESVAMRSVAVRAKVASTLEIGSALLAAGFEADGGALYRWLEAHPAFDATGDASSMLGRTCHGCGPRTLAPSKSPGVVG